MENATVTTESAKETVDTHQGGRRRLRSLSLAAVLVTVTIGLSVTNSPAEATYPGRTNGRIAFGMKVDNNVDIYSVRPDGTRLRRLTTDAGFDACPAYSSDGRRITFCSNRGGTYEIWRMRSDGRDQRQVTHLGFALWPDYSPHGRRIAFEGRSGEDANTEIYLVRPDGTRLRQLTSGDGDNLYPAWSPDGRHIVFESDRTGIPQVWLMNADGTGQTQLTFDATPKDQVPDWSPDGKRIAYTADTAADGSTSEIRVMDANGSHQHAITHDGDDYGPAWSPDGTQLALLDPTTGDVVIVNANGTGRHVVDHLAPQYVPAWQSRGGSR